MAHQDIFGMPLISGENLVVFATDQAHILGKICNDSKQLLAAASIVASLGGNTNELPIAVSRDGPLTVEEIAACAENMDEVIILDETTLNLAQEYGGSIYLNSNVFATSVSIPSLIQDWTNSIPIEWPPMESNGDNWEREPLMTVLVDTITSTWNVEQYKNWMAKERTEHIVGYRGNKPVKLRGRLFKRNR